MNLRRIVGKMTPLFFASIALLVMQSTGGAWPLRDRPSDNKKSSFRDVSTERPVYPGAVESNQVAPAGEIPGAMSPSDSSASTKAADGQADKKASSDKSKSAKKGATPAETNDKIVGQPQAAGMVEIMLRDIVNSVRERGVSDNLARFQRYTGYKLDSSSAAYTGSELAGNCRLSWYDSMLRHPLGAVAEAERFTRDVHTAITEDRGGLAELLPIIAAKLDLPKRQPRKYRKANSPQEAIEILKQALIEAKTAHAAALAPLTKSEIRELASYIYPVMVANNTAAHTLNDRGTGRRLVRSDGKDGPRRAGDGRRGPWPLSRSGDSWSNSSRIPTTAT